MLASLGNAAAQRPTPTLRPRLTGPLFRLIPGPRNFQAGAVYVLMNQVDNTVSVFSHDAFGMRTPADEFSTGEANDPVPQGTAPLVSRCALTLDQGHQFLFAVTLRGNHIR